MDLQVVGRHALLFDDDATADFVNSSGALVEWYSLQIDRYDVRHLLSAPLPPRRRSRNPEHMIFEDPALESQLDHERYMDLPSHFDQPEAEECEKPSNCGGYNAVGFSYGENEYPVDPKKADDEMEFSGFLPPFPIPRTLHQSLPPTEKVHQIIAKTAMFVSKHGGQSEIILRVKQGDNPTFGFLMPDHQLHSYFKFLVEHPDLLQSEYNGKSQGEVQDVYGEHRNTNGVGGALSLLGSAYGSGEEEDGDSNANTEHVLSQDNSHSINNFVSDGSKKMEFNSDLAKDVVVSRSTTPSIKEKVLAVKKNSPISASKSGNTKGSKKDGKSGSFSATVEKVRSSPLGVPSKTESIILEPPPEMTGLIEKIVEFITRNGKQFESTLIEQDVKHGRFPFLLPSNQYNSYYLKVLQTAQELKTNGRSSSVKDDAVGRGDRKAFVHKKNDFSSLDSVGDMPLESDIKEKFKMVIGKPKKDAQESRSKGTEQECGVAVDAAAAAAILQAAIKGVNKSNLSIYNTPLNVQSDINHTEHNRSANPSSLLSSWTENAYRNGTEKVYTLAPKTTLSTSHEALHDPDQEAHLTEEQKVKAERLRRAKMFVAMLKSGVVPLKNQTLRDSSVDPPEAGASMSANVNNLTGKGELSSAPTDAERSATVKNLERTRSGEEHTGQVARRRYRSRAGGCEDNNEEEEDQDGKSHEKGSSRSKYRSRSRRDDEDDENENAEETDEKRYRRRYQSHSSVNENDNEGESYEDRDRECSKPRHRSCHSQNEDDEYVIDNKKVEDHKESRKKHRSHHSSKKRRRSSKKLSDEENESDRNGRDHRRSRKKHRSQHSSGHGRDKDMHTNRHYCGNKKSRHHLKHDSSSDDEAENHTCLDKSEKEIYDVRHELEEGEISSKVSEASRGIVNGHVSRETSIGALISHERANSQPPETTSEVPDDLRAKIRAMLMATRL